MLIGIDVSSWQGDIQVQNLGIEFVIAKSTEGVDYVNPYCDTVIQRCVASGKLWGFYHYANKNNPIAEADYFMDNTRNYFGYGIPVLDWEGVYGTYGNLEYEQPVEWVNEFVSRVHDKTGVWPWIYANPWRFNQGGVEPNCARWVASYPDIINPPVDYDTGEPPETDGLVACWQFASDGRVDGYNGDLDVNVFYGDKGAWDAYAGNHQSDETPEKTILENDEFRVEITKKN